MIRVTFKNLEKSELAKELALERIETVIGRFPDLENHRISVTLSMQNSPAQAGPDVFTVKLFISGRRYKSMVLEKSASSLFVALAEVIEHTLERLNRFGDKSRVKNRNAARNLETFKGDENATEST